MKTETLTKEHKALVEAIMLESEKNITKAICGLHVLKGYLTGRDYVKSINENDESTFLEGMVEMILDKLEAGSEVIYETSSNGNYVVDYQRYESASAFRELDEMENKHTCKS